MLLLENSCVLAILLRRLTLKKYVLALVVFIASLCLDFTPIRNGLFSFAKEIVGAQDAHATYNKSFPVGGLFCEVYGGDCLKPGGPPPP